MTYTIKRLQYHFDLTDEETEYISRAGTQLSQMYRTSPDYFPVEGVMRHGVVFMCYKKGVPCGFIAGTLVKHTLDPRHTILRQEVFYCDPGTRASWYLFNEFLDFGKRNTNYIITMIARHTNLTPRSLKRLGFVELETLYRLEV